MDFFFVVQGHPYCPVLFAAGSHLLHVFTVDENLS